MVNKKGFVFIETIITIVVLATSLLYVYSNFNDILIKEKTRVHYDDPAFIYRTFYIKEFFNKYELDNIKSRLYDDNPLIIIGCDYEGMFETAVESEDNNLTIGINIRAKSTCEDLVSNLSVKQIIISLGDLSYVEEECETDNSSNKCSYLNNLSLEMISYIKTLGNLSSDNENEVIMMIEYESLTNKEVDGETYEEINERNYSWIKV